MIVIQQNCYLHLSWNSLIVMTITTKVTPVLKSKSISTNHANLHQGFHLNTDKPSELWYEFYRIDNHIKKLCLTFCCQLPRMKGLRAVLRFVIVSLQFSMITPCWDIRNQDERSDSFIQFHPVSQSQLSSNSFSSPLISVSQFYAGDCIKYYLLNPESEFVEYSARKEKRALS